MYCKLNGASDVASSINDNAKKIKRTAKVVVKLRNGVILMKPSVPNCNVMCNCNVRPSVIYCSSDINASIKKKNYESNNCVFTWYPAQRIPKFSQLKYWCAWNLSARNH